MSVVFIVISFAISWILWTLIAFTGLDINNNLVVGLFYVIGGFGPSLAGIIQADRNKIRDFWPRVLQTHRIKPHFWLIIPLFYPATILLSYLLSGIIFPNIAAPALSGLPEQTWAYIVLYILSIAIIGPISEELGWRGIMLDDLQKKTSPLVASLLIGIMWWIWHLPLIFVTGSYLHGTSPNLEFIAGYLGTILLYSIIFTWIYNKNNRSILSTIIAHFSINLTLPLLNPPYEVIMVTTSLLFVISTVLVIFEKMWEAKPVSAE